MLFTQEHAVIFKHSRSCDGSSAAHRRIREFCVTQPGAVFHLISVSDSLPVAIYVERETGIPHQSPQVLALKNGMVFNHASHGNITFTFLKTVYAAVSAQGITAESL